jgi:hypothetical protein
MIGSHQRQVNVPEFIAIAEALNADAAELYRHFASEVLADGFAEF